MDKTEARKKILNLMDAATEALSRYGQLAADIKDREPTELLNAQRFVEQAKNLSEQHGVLKDEVRRTEEQVAGSFSDWGEERKQLIDRVLTAGETLPANFNRWVQEYQNSFPDKKNIIIDWQRQKKAKGGYANRFKADFAKTLQMVQNSHQEAERLYKRNRINNEVLAVGKVWDAYQEAEALKNNYPLEQRAIDLAEQVKEVYVDRKNQWYIGLMTQAGLAKFTEVIAQLEQLKKQGIKTIRDILFVFNEAGEFIELKREEFQAYSGEEISIQEVIDHVTDAKVAYVTIKTKQYTSYAEKQLEQDPQGAIDILTNFRDQSISLLDTQNKKQIDDKLADYKHRLQQRQEASHKVDQAETEASAEKAWRLILQAEAQDKNVPWLPNIKKDVGERFQIYLQQTVLPTYRQIGILDGQGEDSWGYHLNRLTELQKLVTGYEPLANVEGELQAVLERLKSYQRLDDEIKKKLPHIESQASTNPQQADADLKPLEEQLKQNKRTTLYPQLESVRQLINAYMSEYINLSLNISSHLTTHNLANHVTPYLKALEDLQYIIDDIKKRPRKEIKIKSIEQNSPITATVSGITEAVTLLLEYVIPWRRSHAEKMAELAEKEKQVQIENIRADILAKRVQASKEQTEKEKTALELTQKRAEVEKMHLENEKLRLELHQTKINLAFSILDKIKPELTDRERVDYAMQLLRPLEVLMSSEVEILGIKPGEDKKALPPTEESK